MFYEKRDLHLDADFYQRNNNNQALVSNFWINYEFSTD